MSLDFSSQEFRSLLYRTSNAIVDLYEKLDERSTTHQKEPSEVRSIFDEPLPDSPGDPATIIDRLATDLVDTSTLNISPHFYGYVVSAGNQMAATTALLQAGLNFCGSKWNLSAGAAEIERTVLRWIAEFIRIPPDGDGILTTGGTSANLIALAVARTARRANAPRNGHFQDDRMTVYASEEVHSSLAGNLDLIGVGKSQLRVIPSDHAFRVDCARLERQIEEDRAAGLTPLCIVGNGGSTNTGSIDDLAELADIAKRQRVWFHVDAAYGGPAASTDLVGSHFRGLDRADSVALDPHKWLYLPLECGCALFREHGVLDATFRSVPAYLDSERSSSRGIAIDEEDPKIDWYTRTYQTTRDTKAIGVWATFQAYGAPRLRSEIAKNIRSMRLLSDLIDRDPGFELMAPTVLSTVCFRFVPPESDPTTDPEIIDRINSALIDALARDGRVFLPGTLVRDRVCLRATTVNHRHEVAHVHQLLLVVRELAAGLDRLLYTATCPGFSSPIGSSGELRSSPSIQKNPRGCRRDH